MDSSEDVDEASYVVLRIFQTKRPEIGGSTYEQESPQHRFEVAGSVTFGNGLQKKTHDQNEQCWP